MKFQFNLSRLLMLCALCTVVLFSSCKKDDDTEDRDNLVGSYLAAENCAGSTDSYVITVTAGTNDDEVIIANIYDSGTLFTATAKVDGKSITIEKQDYFSYGGVTQTIEGNGTLSGTTLTINFTLVTPGYSDEVCTAVCTKQ